MSSEKDLFDAIENFDKQINWDEQKRMSTRKTKRPIGKSSRKTLTITTKRVTKRDQILEVSDESLT